MNSKAERLDKLLDKHPDLKGKWIGFKYDRGEMGVSRIDDDWYECDAYYIDADLLTEFLESKSVEAKK